MVAFGRQSASTCRQVCRARGEGRLVVEALDRYDQHPAKVNEDCWTSFTSVLVNVHERAGSACQ
jgi:hypothetical protein